MPASDLVIFGHYNPPLWAINSIGRVPPLHGGSYRFKSCIAHHSNKPNSEIFY